MFEQTFKNIDDILHKDAGCTSELDYTEQSSWLLFLKYLDALEHDKAAEAELEGKTTNYTVVSQEEAFINGFWDQEADIFRVERPVVVFGDHTRALKYIDFDFVLGADGVKVLKPKPFLHPRFFYYQLHTAKLGSLGYARHYRLLKNHVVAYPSYAEQQRIVAILDEAFEGIATAKVNAEKNLQNAREMFDGCLRDVFRKPGPTWTQTPVDQRIRFIDYRGKTPQKTSEGLRLITAKNVKKGFIQEEPMEFVAPGSYEGWMTRGIPKLGDVLFTTEAPLGNVAQLDTAERVAFAQRIIIMQADPAVLDSAFLKYMLLSEPMQAKLHAQATGATAQGIKASLLKRIPISFPNNLGKQAAIVDRLDSLAEETSRLEGLHAAKVAALAELKKSLLHQAFSGAL